MRITVIQVDPSDEMVQLGEWASEDFTNWGDVDRTMTAVEETIGDKIEDLTRIILTTTRDIAPLSAKP